MEHKLYACGSNGNCQLGLGHEEDVNVPAAVPFEAKDKIVKIVGGGNHTLILLKNGDIWAAGDNTYGQCGIIPCGDLLKLKTFTKIQQPAHEIEWADMACGWEFSILLDKNGNAYSCGFGSKGELGLGLKVSKSFFKDELVEADKHIDDSNNKGGLETKNLTSFKPISIPSATCIKASINHVVLQCSNGDIYGWGYNKNFKLGEKLPKTIWQPTKLDIPMNTRFALGRDYTVFYTDSEITLKGSATKIKADLDQCKSLQIVSIKTMWSSMHLQTHNNQIVSLGNNSHGQKLRNLKGNTISLFETGSEHGLLCHNYHTVYAWGWGEHGNCGVHSTKPENDVTFDLLNKLFEANNKVYLISGGCATTFIATC